MADVLDQAAAELDKGFPGSKATEGALRDALGKWYYEPRPLHEAVEMHRNLVTSRVGPGAEHPDTLSSRNDLAVA